MAQINPKLKSYEKQYLFSKVYATVSSRKKTNLLNLGIGDISLPLAPAIQKALIDAANEMAETPIGYGPATGYDFLKSSIKNYFYDHLNVQEDEIFIADGICPDLSDFSELFATENIVCIPNPTYPLYRDLNEMAGRKIIDLPLNEENNFSPQPPEEKVQIIYLCCPNNPTGTVFTYEELANWVEYANKNNSVIFYDAAYEAFIKDSFTPKSIYEIPGAENVAIEFKSFSKVAGFTGLRCSFSIVPKTLMGSDKIHQLWKLRQETKTNGVAYPIQKAAAASLSTSGLVQTFDQVQEYMKGTRAMKEALVKRGFTVYGGENSPYIWWKIPPSFSSWDFFEYLLDEHNIICTPGSGFGAYGEGYVRLSGFANKSQVNKAIDIINQLSLSYAN